VLRGRRARAVRASTRLEVHAAAGEERAVVRVGDPLRHQPNAQHLLVGPDRCEHRPAQREAHHQRHHDQRRV